MRDDAMIIRRLYLFFVQKLFKVFGPKEVSISSLYTTVSRASKKIPNSVYQTWKYPLLPPFHAKGVERFRRMNHDYSFFFFDDLQMCDYMRTRYAGHPILKVFDKVRIPAAKADIWRYCVLLREGGIYCDIDSAISIPLRELLAGDPSELISFEGNRWIDLLDIGKYAELGIFRETIPETVTPFLEYPQNIVLNWVLCFEKGHPILEEVLELIVRHFDFYRNKTFESMWKAVIHSTGPLALTQAIWSWMARTGRRPAQCGIDFAGKGIFKLPASGFRDRVSPHFSTLNGQPLALE